MLSQALGHGAHACRFAHLPFERLQLLPQLGYEAMLMRLMGVFKPPGTLEPSFQVLHFLLQKSRPDFRRTREVQTLALALEEVYPCDAAARQVVVTRNAKGRVTLSFADGLQRIDRQDATQLAEEILRDLG